ncbi:MAG: hypothetical protein K0U68_05745 [Gammaproteobacteria bacterium]|nr:hypothetical protein [Gammaproteobacteria bacterium]
MIGFMHFKCVVQGMLYVLLGLMSAISHIRADQSSSASIDCSTAKVEFTENPEWTRQERIEAMNKAFYLSVQRYQVCQLSKQSNGLTGSAQSGNQASDADLQSGVDSGQTGMNSVANPLLTGTETNPRQDSLTSNSTVKNSTEKTPVVPNTSVIANGKTPEDIPVANNDDAIAAQIRLAAEIEKDPDKKARLWNEYRKYKGLPTQ